MADTTGEQGQQQSQPRTPLSPLDAFRMMQERGAQLVEAGRRLTREATQGPAGLIPDPLSRLFVYLADLSTIWVNPLRTILEEQQQLADMLSSWAKQQKELGETMSQWAEHHRAVIKQLNDAVQPMMEAAEWASQMSRSFGQNLGRSRGQDS